MPAQEFSDVFWNQFYRMRRMLEVQPLNLGGVSASGGGIDGRPGSFFGMLPQTRVTYDKSELGTQGSAGSPTLLDNLNHIRYRIDVLEGRTVIKQGGTVVASGIAVLDFSTGSGFSVTESPTGEANISLSNEGYAEIYVAGGSTAQSISNGSTYVKLTGFTTDGLSKRCTADASNDRIVFTRTGVYSVTGSISASSGTGNVVFKFAVFLNSVEQSKIQLERAFATLNDVGSGSFSGLVDVTTSGWVMDLRAVHDFGSSVNITPTYLNLTVVYLGET
jgi:hypothetical protein